MTSISRAISWHDPGTESGSRSLPLSVGRKGVVRDIGKDKGAGVSIGAKESEREGGIGGRSGAVGGVSASISVSASEKHPNGGAGVGAKGRGIERDVEDAEGSRRARQYAAAVVLERDVGGRDTKTTTEREGEMKEQQQQMDKESVIQNRLVHYGVYCGPGPADAFSGDNKHNV
jgi:hypothetical protein